ncbi:MAG: porin [Burkholderiales bacterium]|nr:porin [Burkholderiales bacterium]
MNNLEIHMKKSLLALAVLGAFAGAASAQSSVTLYGLLDIGMIRIDPKNTSAPGAANCGGPIQMPASCSATTGIATGIQSGPRFGLRGSEDLGGGLRAVYQLENGFSVDDGTLGQGGRIFGRWAWAGLAGSWGEVRLGRQWAFGFEMMGSIDPWATGFNDAGIQSVMSTANAVRPDNMIAYRSANLSGVRFNLGYSWQTSGAEVAESSKNNRFITAGASYSAGPLMVVGTYEIYRPALTSSIVSPDDAKYLQLGATYAFKVAKISAAYAIEEAIYASGPSSPSSLQPRRFALPTTLPKGVTGPQDATAWQVGVTVPVGSLNLIGSWAQRDFDAAALNDGRVYAVGFTYPLSRRTNFYGYYSDASHKDILSGDDRKEMAVGIRHSF